MASPIARVRRARKPPPTAELSITKRRQSTSLIETSPFRQATASTAPVAGEKFGPFLVYEQLGEGGMARVHRAEMTGAAGFKKTVALKRMRTITSEDPDFVASFVHEGQLIGRLKHPNIAQAYELGKIEGTYYIAMEYVPGPTLAQIMAQSRRCAGAIPLPIVLEILIQLCDALEHAHDLRDEGGKSLDLIHRDVSPMNIIVSRAGAAKLIDFGIAKVARSCIETQAGIIKGKHAYVAPEYTLGTGLDRRVDLWGLGVVAHEMITGRRLFLGDTEAETIRNVRLMPINPPSRIAQNISRELDDIVMTALQRDPDQRWQNAGAMRAALTAEARRQRAVVSGAQLRDWIEWAFRQPTREDSPIRHMLDDLEPSISIQMHDLEECDVSGMISRTDPDDVPTVDAVKPPPKIVIARDVIPAAAIPRMATARAQSPRAPTPIQLARNATAIPSLASPARGTPIRVTPVRAVDIDENTTVIRRRPPSAEPSRPYPGAVPEPLPPEVSVPHSRPTPPLRAITPRPETPVPSRRTPPLRAVTPVSRQTPPLRAIAPRPETPVPSAVAFPGAVSRAASPVPSAVAFSGAVSRAASPVPSAIELPRAPSPRLDSVPDLEAVPRVVAIAPTSKVTPLARPPRWNPPTRWNRAEKPTQWPQLMVLLMLGAFAALAIQLGWIDLDRWQQIIDTYR